MAGHTLPRPDGVIHTVPLPVRADALELATMTSRVAAALDRAWAPDAAYQPTKEALVRIAALALELRSKL